MPKAARKKLSVLKPNFIESLKVCIQCIVYLRTRYSTLVYVELAFVSPVNFLHPNDANLTDLTNS